jgi:predicted AlkP superfamily pyrophosphatase or phosphodiesterase
LRPEFYQNSHYPSAELQSIAKKGIVFPQGIKPVFPTVTYPNHATLVTGVLPSEHGIITNTLFDFRSGPLSDWFWEAKHLKKPAIWDLVRNAGKKVGIIRWPVSVGAQAAWNFPEIFVPGVYFEKATWQEVEKHTDPTFLKSIQELTGEDSCNSFEHCDHWSLKIGKHLIQTTDVSLILIHLGTVDFIQHNFGREGPELRAGLKKMDADLGEFFKGIDWSQWNLILIGDHGFWDYQQSVYPNKLLKDEGWITVKDGKVTDWQVYFHASGGQGGVYVKDPTSLEGKKLALKAKEILAKNAKGKYQILTRNQLDKLGAYPQVIFALSGYPGWNVGGGFEKFTEKHDKVKGVHGPLESGSSYQMNTGLVVLSDLKKYEINQVKSTKDVMGLALKILKIKK